MDREFESNLPEAEPGPIKIAATRQIRSRVRRFLAFFPPFLLVTASLGLIAYRSTNPNWEGLSRVRLFGAFGRPVAAPPRSSPNPNPKPVAPPAPIVVKAVPEAPPQAPKLEIAAKASEPSPAIALPPPRPDPPRPEATPGLPLAAIPVLAPTPDPSPPPPADDVPSKPDPAIAEMNAQIELARRSQEAKDEIMREAQRKRLEREGLEALKPTVAANEERDARQKEGESVKRAYTEAEADRAAYLAELREALVQQGPHAGPAIRQISERHRLEPHPVILKTLGEVLKRTTGRLDRSKMIALKRQYGLPEEMIVAELAIEEWKNHIARNGPKTEYEALVRAAKHVLAVPIVPPSGRAPVAPVIRRPVDDKTR